MISDINELANEVDHIVTSNPTAKNVFIRQIDKLCKMVEDYAQAQEPYTKELEKAKKQIEKGKNPTQFNRPLTDICPPPNGYVETSQQANRFVKVPPYNIYRPIEPVNPLLWFECFGDVNKQRKPTEVENLMCDYVLLAIVHDYTQRISRTAMDFCFWFKDDEEKWADDVLVWYEEKQRLFNKRAFFDKIGGYYAANHQNGLVRALERIKADIAAAPDDGFISAPQIMKRLNLPKSKRKSLDRRLKQFRDSSLYSGEWTEHDCPAANQARFYYNFAKVEPILKDL